MLHFTDGESFDLQVPRHRHVASVAPFRFHGRPAPSIETTSFTASARPGKSSTSLLQSIASQPPAASKAARRRRNSSSGGAAASRVCP